MEKLMIERDSCCRNHTLKVKIKQKSMILLSPILLNKIEKKDRLGNYNDMNVKTEEKEKKMKKIKGEDRDSNNKE